MWSCSSAKLVSNWKDPDTVLFHAYKVLIVGMTENESAREDFETKLQNEFRKRNVEAVRSIDLFDVNFTTTEQSEKQLSEVEEQLLDKDFDAILFTKIIGSENKKTLRTKLADTDRFLNTFSDDYLSHQAIFYEGSYYDNYTVFHAETALYCICVGKERETIWKAGIDITEPKNFNKTINTYIKLIVEAMEEQDIIFYSLDI
jgi:signal recognition particle GTPase